MFINMRQWVLRTFQKFSKFCIFEHWALKLSEMYCTDSISMNSLLKFENVSSFQRKDKKSNIVTLLSHGCNLKVSSLLNDQWIVRMVKSIFISTLLKYFRDPKWDTNNCKNETLGGTLISLCYLCVFVYENN